MTAHIVVIGGGISGVAACWWLEQAAPSAVVTLVEACHRLGGWIRTERWGEVLIEHGPDSWVASKPAATVLARAVGLERELIGLLPENAGASIVIDGRSIPLPEGLSFLVPTRLWPMLTSPLLSFSGKLRVLGELLVPPRTDTGDESIASFVRRRFGREFLERLAEPLLAGIYAGDTEQLSILATYPQLRDLEREYGSLVRAVWRRRKTAGSVTTRERSPFLTLRGGMQCLVDGTVGRLTRTSLRLGIRAVALEAAPSGYRLALSDGSVLEVDGAVVATPAASTAVLLEPMLGDEVGWLRGLPYASSAAVTLVYRRQDVEAVAQGRGFLVPARERRPVSAVTWVTNKFPGRAPADWSVVRVFFRSSGGVTGAENGERLVALALQELRALTGLQATPLHAVVSLHQEALPQYLVGHRDRVVALRAVLERWRGLAVAGAAFDGVGVPDCIASGWNAARAVAEGLGLAPSVSG